MCAYFRVRYDLGKDQSELTWADFERFPVWVNCLELEDMYGETFFAPIAPPIAVPREAGLTYVRAEFVLADGTLLPGLIRITAYVKELEGIVLLLDGEFFSVEAPPSDELIRWRLEQGRPFPDYYLQWLKEFGHEALCHRLGKSPQEVFPIYFRCPVGFEGENEVIEGKYPIDFRTDMPIKLGLRCYEVYNDLAKSFDELTWEDFERFPVWISIIYRIQEVAPIHPFIVPTDVDEVYVRTEFVLFDGTKLSGIAHICGYTKELDGISLLLKDEFFHILYDFKQKHKELCQRLGKKPKEVFPIRFRCPVGFEDEEGVIEGKYPIDFSDNKPINLSKKKKRKKK